MKCVTQLHRISNHSIDTNWTQEVEMTDNKGIPCDVVVDPLQWYPSSYPICTILKKVITVLVYLAMYHIRMLYTSIQY